MKTGDTIIVATRYPKLSKYLMRNQGYEYGVMTLIIKAIFDNVLLIAKLNGDDAQFISRPDWEYINMTKRNWR